MNLLRLTYLLVQTDSYGGVSESDETNNGFPTPIQITVTCAEAAKTGSLDPGQDLVVPHGATTDEVRQVFSRAADRAVKSGEPVVVRLEQ